MTKARLSDEQYKVIDGPLWTTWGAIAPDAEPMCQGDNECAVEMCIDAGRLLEYGGEGAQEADAVIKGLLREHTYPTVLRMLADRFVMV